MITVVIVCVLVTALVGLVQRSRYQAVQTPDGMYYARMGAGLTVPRPYALRLMARLIPPTFEAWDVTLWVSMLSAAGLGGAFLFIGSGNPMLSIAAVVAWMTAPNQRRMWTWPVLMDAPMMAFACGIALALVTMPMIAVILAVVACMVHERTAIYGAAFALLFGFTWWVALVALVPFVYVALMWSFTKPASEHDPEWLHFGPRDFIRHHLKEIHTIKSWTLPLGVGCLWLCCPSWELATIAAIGYGGVVMAMDRQRIIAPAALPLTFAVLAWLPAFLILPATIIHWFTQHDEV